MRNFILGNSLIVLLLLAWVLSQALFVVDEREVALKFRFKKIVESGQEAQSNYGPGLHFKIPFIDTISKFDDRILGLESPREEFLTSEKKNLVVDFFVKWQIIDPAAFYRSVNQSGVNLVLGRQAFERSGEIILIPIIRDALSTEFRIRTVPEVVSTERNELMADILKKSITEAKQKGVRIVDVRVKRIDLPDEVSGSVFNRMRQERHRIAKQLRAEGEEEAQRIRAEAERERTVQLANAYGEAEEIRGEGDAVAADTYAKAYRKNPEFYEFYRSMEAYRNSVGQNGDVLVLSPDNEFFKYLNQSRPK